MLKELGFGIYDENKGPVADGALGLSKAASISIENMIPHLNECSFTVACDVKNPLFGEDGASFVFAPQKGAAEEDVKKMDCWMRDFSCAVKDTFPNADPFVEGSGAAGGLGFAFLAFLGGKMEPGADVLLARTDIEKEISLSDLVITGEGRIDEQTYMGKAPVRIARIAKKHNKPVVAVAGCVAKGADKCHAAGIDVILPVVSAPMTVEDAMKYETARENLKRTACELIRLMNAL
jgi:glycerate kinase